MITARQCRIYAAKCDEIALLSAHKQRSLEQTLMATNWHALANQIDFDNRKSMAATGRFQ